MGKMCSLQENRKLYFRDVRGNLLLGSKAESCSTKTEACFEGNVCLCAYRAQMYFNALDLEEQMSFKKIGFLNNALRGSKISNIH